MKRIATFLLALLIITCSAVPAFAAGSDKVSVNIVSPNEVVMKPVYEGTISIEVTNNSDTALNNLICYLSIVDIERGLSYNVDEFGKNAYQTRPLSLGAGETTTVDIPVKVSYVGDFRFTVTVIDIDAGEAFVARSLKVNMLSASELNRPLATVTAIVMPVLCIGVTLLLFRRRKLQSKAGE